MNGPAHLNSQASRAASSVIAFDIRPSRRIQFIACGIFLTLILAVLLAPGLAIVWRALTMLAIAVLAARPLLQCLWTYGTHAPTHVEWTAEGIWRLQFAGRSSEDAVLLNESAILGPLVFLIWSHSGSRRFAIIDSASTDPVIFRTLRSRLRLNDNPLHAGRKVLPDRLRASCDSYHATSVRVGRTPEL